MQSTPPDISTGTRPADPLALSLEAVERQLAELGVALRNRDAAGVECHAAELHRALAAAMQRFTQASRQTGGVPQALRQRLALAGGQVAAQRESMARATAALDRAIDVLLPQTAHAVYGHPGQAERPLTSAALHA
ncbi:MAG: hypothetical protein V4792_08420 [Pseudomonadota bacterium]